MHSTVLDYIDLAVLFIVSAICVCMFALLMVEWSVPISYNRDKSTINLNADRSEGLNRFCKESQKGYV